MGQSGFQGFGIKVIMPFIDLPDRKVDTVHFCYFMLKPTTVEYCIGARFSKLCDKLGMWVEQDADYMFTRSKEGISDISMWLSSESGKYVFSVEWSGVNGSTDIHFDTREDCKSIYDTFVSYKYSDL